MEIRFVKMGINGEGIGYLDGKPVFCDGVFPNETADVNITEKKPHYYRAEIKKMIWRSKERFRTDYPYAKEEGCSLFEMKYDAQLRHKKKMLEEALYKYAHIRAHFVRDMHASPATIGYRSECKLPVRESRGHITTGMYEPGTNHFHPIRRSLIQDPLLEDARIRILKAVDHSHLHAYDPKEQKGLRYLLMRIIDGKIQVTLVTGKDKVHRELIEDIMKDPHIQGLFQSINTDPRSIRMLGSEVHKLAGQDTLPVPIRDITLQLSPASFYQLNPAQAENLYTMAVSKIDKCETLVEAYCGVGAMSLLAHKKAKKIYGIESIQDAVDNASANAEANDIDNCTFLCADAAEGLARVASRQQVDCLVADPPRSGMDDAMIRTILKAKPKKIIYISCNPSTLARNLDDLKHQYHVVTILPYDMFPHTPHIESITVLERDNYKEGQAH